MYHFGFSIQTEPTGKMERELLQGCGGLGEEKLHGDKGEEAEGGKENGGKITQNATIFSVFML